MAEQLNWWDRWRLGLAFRRGNPPLGRKGELVAQRFLRRRGMRIIEHSMRNAFGEIDLVAIDRRTVVFVEVKTRTSDYAGEPAEAVDDNKQRHMTAAALAFLRKHRLLEHAARFDVVTIVWSDAACIPAVEHIVNAFSPAGDYQMFS